MNWGCQKDVFTRLLSKDLLGITGREKEHSLLLTVPPFCPDVVQDNLDELVFEELGFASLCRMPAAPLSALGYEQQQPASAFALAACQLVIDVGHSFTHVTPMFNGTILRRGVKRINVGGKLLTNYLKEVVSYRQWNMMDDTVIIEDAKKVGTPTPPP
jgi:actin-related protein 6